MGGSGPANPAGGTVEEFLEHFGVKGMRWGVRKSKPSTDSDDVKTKKAIGKKVTFLGNTDKLTNDELQTLVTRMNLEQQYDRLSSSSGKAKLEGAKFVVDTLVAVGKSKEAKLAVNFAAKQVASLLNKK